jgi:uncharacterized membrane protein YhdT
MSFSGVRLATITCDPSPIYAANCVVTPCYSIHSVVSVGMWTMGRWTTALALLKMVTVVVPTRDAVRGYRQLRDPAWFIHPILCLYVPVLYAFLYAQSRWRNGVE